MDKKRLDDELIFLGQQCDLLWNSASELAKSKRQEELKVIGPLCIAVVESAKSFKLLCSNEHYRDAFVTSRTLLETIINVAFMCAKGIEATEKANRHAIQKTKRDLERKIEIEGHVIKQALDATPLFDSNPKLKESLEEFTSPRRREITKWTEESVLQKIEEIERKYGSKVSNFLLLPFYFIYRHSSEIAHGSYFGLLYIKGLTQLDRKLKDIEDTIRYFGKSELEIISLIAFMNSLSLNGLLYVLGKEFEIEKFKDESNQLLSQHLEKMGKYFK